MEVVHLNHGINDIVISSPSNEHYITIDQCIINIIKKEGFITYDIIKKELVQDGGNYMGIPYEIDIKGKTKDEEQKIVAIFVKTMLTDHADIEFLSVQDAYDRENFVYDELSKIFDKMQNEAAILEEKRYKMVKSYDETHPQAVFLENVAKKGFRTWFRMDEITLDYAEECIKQLARFHGLSFVLEVKQTDYFNRFIKPLKHGLKPGKGYEELCNFAMSAVLKMLDSCVKDRLKEDDLRNLIGKFIEYLNEKDSVCCLCHGDYRPNNIMHKTVKGRVTEVIPVDYQVVYYGCPVLDIIFFLYSSTDHQFRENHLQHLKDLYHETLTEFLNNFNMSVDSVFPKNRFEELYEKKKEFGLITTFIMGPFIYADEKKVTKLIDVKNQSKAVLNERYRDRLYDAIKEFFDI